MSKLPKIMVVDDEKPIVSTVSEYLLAEGFDVHGYTKPEEALVAIRQFKPDVILLDIMMPGMGGYEFCQRVKAIPDVADIPVIFVTAKQLEEDALSFLQSGGFLFINKPFRLPEMKELLLLTIKDAMKF